MMDCRNADPDYTRGYAEQAFHSWQDIAARYGAIDLADFCAGQYDAAAFGFMVNA